MSRCLRVGMAAVVAVGALLGLAGSSSAQEPSRKERGMSRVAKGEFDVKLVSLASEKAEGATLGRTSIDKQFHGDLEAASKGEMLSAMTEVKGSAGYVAIERVVGTLHGKKGSFVLQHTGTMTRGAPELSVTVVPDSGTGDLKGLTGKLEIQIADGKHSYVFEYQLEEKP